tara:strand:- start:7604 stop:8857 length:1254 start_codon:yes stop_codon:yes gene_type:complete
MAELTSAEQGKLDIELAEQNMPVLMKLREEFEKTKPFEGLTIGCCLHVTKETAVLMRTLKAGGANVGLYSSNPLSTDDNIAEALQDEIECHAKRGETYEVYKGYLAKILDMKPNICISDGGELIIEIHQNRPELLEHVIGGTEETTTGIIRFRNMEKDGALKFPLVSVNDSMTKHMFDNRYGTGQSTMDGVLRSANRMIAGSTFVVGGYGWCSRGIAMRARGMGANVIVTEIDAIKALEAHMDGFRVMPMDEAAKLGNFFITSTGNTDVITVEHMKSMKNGAVLGNAGHFNVEVMVKELEESASSKKKVRRDLDEYILDGKKIYLIGEGRLANLVAAEGHPAEVMDMSFANQALAAKHLVDNKGKLKAGVIPLPSEIDVSIAKTKLDESGIKMDELSKRQKEYLAAWGEGAFKSERE